MDVIKKNRVQYMKIEYDINREDYFDEINKFFPDIIISS